MTNYDGVRKSMHFQTFFVCLITSTSGGIPGFLPKFERIDRSSSNYFCVSVNHNYKNRFFSFGPNPIDNHSHELVAMIQIFVKFV